MNMKELTIYIVVAYAYSNNNKDDYSTLEDILKNRAIWY